MRDEADQGGEGADEAASTEAIEARRPGAELFFGLVGAMGVDLDRVCQVLAERLHAVGYATRLVTVDGLADALMGDVPPQSNPVERLGASLSNAAQLRRSLEKPDILARLGIAHIRVAREGLTGGLDVPAQGVAYIAMPFQRPEEVALFREVYGPSFTLVSAYAPREDRGQRLALTLSATAVADADLEGTVERLMARDREEDEQFGRLVADVFPMGDFFVDANNDAALVSGLMRLVRLTFAEPFISPTREEQGMFFALAAALRSLDLSRQVGAAITSLDGDLIATGCNEVPKPGGGLYWAEDDLVVRDAELGHDPNVATQAELVADALERMSAQGWLVPHLNEQSPAVLARSALAGEDPFMRRSRLFDVIEFGRAVHAEMAAITQAAKDGRALRGARMYCTTFPCHICARHIVATGISEVVFIEPYEKSRAHQLYADSISVESNEPSRLRVMVRAFIGVAPRRYMEYFSMGSARRKTADGRTVSRSARAWGLRFHPTPASYLLAERRVLHGLPEMR